MTKLLHAIDIQGFKGIGAEMQLVTGLQKINFFIGENNSGKSTILQYVANYISEKSAGQASNIIDEHVHRGSRSAEHSFQCGIPPADFRAQIIGRVANLARRPPTDHQKFSELLDKLITEIAHEKYIWLKARQNSNKLEPIIDKTFIKTVLSDHNWRFMWNFFRPDYSGGDANTWFTETLSSIFDNQILSIPVAPLIPAVRQIGKGEGKFSDFDGVGIIDQLARMQNPDYNNRGKRSEFDKINDFLASVTGQQGSSIEIPYERNSILVHMNGRTLPIESLGTGIHEVVLLATFCTITSRKIVCIEEPELHLHPILQRKLISYINNNTEIQYFIATHSSAFIDTPDATIYHVYLEGNTTQISKATLASERHAICADLGYRASDIVQSNAIVWVEGPSDRIYINHWLNSLDQNLVEGTHYSIMFYGGRNLSHLTANDQAVSDFICLRDLNRNVAVVIDSDRSSSEGGINATKKRICDEIRAGGGVAWITQGREIENYIEHEVLQAAVAKTHPRIYHSADSGKPYDHALYFHRIDENSGKEMIEKNVDKVAVAHAVCKGPVNLQVLDLEGRIGDLVAMIRKANHIEAIQS